MKLPWVSRERYDEMKQDLKAQITALEADRQRLLDHVQKLSVGVPIYEAPAPAPAPKDLEPAQMLAETAEQRRQNDVREAQQAGYRSPRAIAEYITRKNHREFEAKQQNVAASFDLAEKEGRDAAAAKATA